MIHACRCVYKDSSAATTFTPNGTWGRPLLLCGIHADLHREGHSFVVYSINWR